MKNGSLVHGMHAVRAALKYDSDKVLECWVERGRRDVRMQTLREAFQRLGVKVHDVPRRELDRLTQGATHQGVAVRYEGETPRSESDLDSLLATLDEPPFLLVLDQVQDPHNLGACLRTADGAGVHAVVAPRDRAVGLTPVVHKVASGGSRSVPFFQVTNLTRTLRTLKQAGIWLVGLTGDAPDPVYGVELTGPLALVMGGEGKGLRRLTGEACDHLAHIPMRGSVESLNVSVATGIALYEAVRQRLGAVAG